MPKQIRQVTVALLVAIAAATAIVGAQQQGALTAAERTRRIETEKELQSLAVVDRKVMMAMPDELMYSTPVKFSRTLPAAPSRAWYAPRIASWDAEEISPVKARMATSWPEAAAKTLRSSW